VKDSGARKHPQRLWIGAAKDIFEFREATYFERPKLTAEMFNARHSG
jgi:hypothetical protein